MKIMHCSHYSLLYSKFFSTNNSRSFPVVLFISSLTIGISFFWSQLSSSFVFYLVLSFSSTWTARSFLCLLRQSIQLSSLHLIILKRGNPLARQNLIEKSLSGKNSYQISSPSLSTHTSRSSIFNLYKFLIDEVNSKYIFKFDRALKLILSKHSSTFKSCLFKA